MQERMPITIGEDTVDKFIAYCRERGLDAFMLVADKNTAAALGDRVHTAISQQGWDVLYCVLDPDGLHTDGTAVTRVLRAHDAAPRTFVSVGSGTITDTTRFASHRSGNPFISFPTAASVDAYASKTAAITIGRLKGSVVCQAPEAIFTDMPTICHAPRFLTASGFGDLVSKLTSTCDWKLTHIIWGSDFDEGIYWRGVSAGQSVAAVIDGIRAGDTESMQVMMEGQFEGGFCMADFNNSAPASGSEHHIAHVWEMLFHWDGKEGLFHGNAVGVAMLMSARWYAQLRAMTREDARTALERTIIPPREEQEAALRKALPEIAEEVIASNPIYLQLSEPETFERIKTRILEQWDEIQTCANKVPDPDQLREWISSLGEPVTPQEIRVSAEETRLGKDFGLYLRERFSINIIRSLFGWE